MKLAEISKGAGYEQKLLGQSWSNQGGNVVFLGLSLLGHPLSIRCCASFDYYAFLLVLQRTKLMAVKMIKKMAMKPSLVDISERS